MDKRQKNHIIALTAVAIGVILIIWCVPIVSLGFSYPIIGVWGFSSYFNLNLFILAFPLFIYAYFMVNPVKSSNRRILLAIIALVFGVVLILMSIIGITFEIYYLAPYASSLFLLLCCTQYFITLIPSLDLIIYGRFMLKETQNEERVKNLIIIVTAALIGVILFFYSAPTVLAVFLGQYSGSLIFMGFFLNLELFIFAFPFFIHAGFMVKPLKTPERRIILGRFALVTGIVLILFTIMGITFELYYYIASFGLSFLVIVYLARHLIILIPSLVLIIRGRFILKETRDEKRT